MKRNRVEKSKLNLSLPTRVYESLKLYCEKNDFEMSEVVVPYLRKILEDAGYLPLIKPESASKDIAPADNPTPRKVGRKTAA